MVGDSSDAAEIALHRRVVEAAVRAPTADNNQPWRFVSRQRRLELFLDPDRALSSDVHSMFDLLGLGAALENIRIAASQIGCVSFVQCAAGLCDAAVAAGRSPVAIVSFQPGGRADPLAVQLGRRATCRAHYRCEPVDATVRTRLAQAAAEFADVQVDWIVERSALARLARLVASGDRIRFEHEPFHAELFRQLRFAAAEAEATCDGLDVRALALPPGAAALLGSLRSWKRMRLVHRFGLGPLLALPSWLSVRRSGAVGLLSAAEAGVSSFLDGGRALQRIWLTAAAEGLALQPLGSLPIFLAHLRQLGGSKLAARHCPRIERLGARLENLAPAVGGRTPMMLFRLGLACPPERRSLRRPVEDVFEAVDEISPVVENSPPVET